MGGGTIRSSEKRVDRFQLQRSVYGDPLPIAYGTQRLSGNLVHLLDFKAIAHVKSESAGGKGGGVTTETTSYTYEAAFVIALAEGPVTDVLKVWQDNNQFDESPTAVPLADLGLELATGAEGQTIWGYLTAMHASEAIPYSGVALVRGAGRELSESAALQNYSVEAKGRCLGYNGLDADPAAVVVDLLTHARYGAGFDAGLIGDLTVYADYCKAQGLALSPLLDRREAASQILGRLLDLTNSAALWSEGQLKVVPYGDTALTANGATFTPDVTPLYDLTDDDFLRDEGDGDPPLKVRRRTSADALNRVAIEWLNRANQYAPEVTEAKDQAGIERDGIRSADAEEAHWICDATVARTVVQLLLQRQLYTRNEYEFRLGWRYCTLEPMDIVTVTDAGLGLDHTPVRIVSIEEDEGGALSILAEDFPRGIGHAAAYPHQTNQSAAADADPGDVLVPVIMEAPPALTDTGLALRVAVTGSNPFWGGCEIWRSLDNASYSRFGRIAAGARYGTLVNAIGAADTSATVTLSGLGGELAGASAQAAALLKTLCWIEGEYLAFETATLVAANTYALGGLIRGAYGTTAAAHSAGSRFARVDDATLLGEDLTLDHLDKTIYLKFASFNVFGGGNQSLDAVVPYQYTINGTLLRSAPPEPTGLTFTAQPDGVNLKFSRPAWRVPLRVEVHKSATAGGTYALVATVDGDNYVDPSPGGTASYYKCRSIDRFGIQSSFTGVVSATSKTVEDGATVGAPAGTTVGGTEATAVRDQANTGYLLTQYGSQIQLGGLANGVQVAATGYVIASANAMTALASGAVNINSHTVQYGSLTVTYNAVSSAVTGLTQGVAYWIYTDDALFQGGTRSYAATTSAPTAFGANGRYVVGKITIPTSGSGGSGGGGDNCVAAASWLPGGLRAGSAPVGHLLPVRTDKGAFQVGKIEARRRVEDVPCVRISAACGASLVCSRKTPFTLPDGVSVPAEDLFGEKVLVARDERVSWQRVTTVDDVGVRDVMRISVGGHSFPAGEYPDALIFSHNLIKP